MALGMSEAARLPGQHRAATASAKSWAAFEFGTSYRVTIDSPKHARASLRTMGFARIDLAKGRVETVIELSGFTRGLAVRGTVCETRRGILRARRRCGEIIQQVCVAPACVAAA